MNTAIIPQTNQQIARLNPKAIVEQELFRKIKHVEALALKYKEMPNLKNSLALRQAETEIIIFVLGGLS